MVGLGTVINVAAIVVGGTAGALVGSRISRRFQETLHAACAVAVMFIGIAGAMQGMLAVVGGEPAGPALEAGRTLLVVLSLVLGALMGEALDLHTGIMTVGEWLRRRTGSVSDSRFTDAFVTASVTVCVGAMAVVGAIEDGLSGDYSVLTVKAVLDLVIVLAMAASMGRGCVFSAIPVALFQGFFTATAVLIKPVMTPEALANLSTVGSVLIFCVGLNLLWPGRIKVANLLPAIAIAPAAALLPWAL